MGTVRWFKDEKGYGRITADDGEVLFVHTFPGSWPTAIGCSSRANACHSSGMAVSEITAAIGLKTCAPNPERWTCGLGEAV